MGAYYIYALCYPSGSPFYFGYSSQPDKQRLLGHYSEARLGKKKTIKNDIIRALWARGEIVGFRKVYAGLPNEFAAQEMEGLAMWFYEGRLANRDKCPPFKQIYTYSDAYIRQWIARERRALKRVIRYYETSLKFPRNVWRIEIARCKLALLEGEF